MLNGLRLDLGCGKNKKEGFIGVDISKDVGADVVFDLSKKKWPFKDGEVEEVHCSHFLEHLTGAQRINFMNELYRITKVGAKAVIITPYHASMRAIQDPTHQWPPVCEHSYLYFNKGWREANGLEHYGINCDFDFSYGYAIDPDVSNRNAEYQLFAFKHYLNAINDLQVTLIRRE